MEKVIHFVIPPPGAFPSGGNIYNAKLLRGLQSIGVSSIQSLKIQPELKALKDQFFLVDSLFLHNFDPELFASDCLLIVHHLLAMEKSGAEASTIYLKEKKRLEKYQGFLSTSTFTTDFLSHLGLSQPVITLPPVLSLPTDALSIADSASSMKVLIVANLIRRKGILYFLKEWNKYEWPDHFFLEIIGSPKLEPQYAQACLKYRESLADDQRRKINFTGPLDQKVVFDKYHKAQLLLSASEMETFGMAIQEAIACRLPVFILKGGYAARHIGSQGNGQVFESIPRLVKALKIWSQDSTLRSQYQRAAQKAAPDKLHTWEDAARDFLQQIQTLFP